MLSINSFNPSLLLQLHPLQLFLLDSLSSMLFKLNSKALIPIKETYFEYFVASIADEGGISISKMPYRNYCIEVLNKTLFK